MMSSNFQVGICAWLLLNLAKKFLKAAIWWKIKYILNMMTPELRLLILTFRQSDVKFCGDLATKTPSYTQHLGIFTLRR